MDLLEWTELRVSKEKLGNLDRQDLPVNLVPLGPLENQVIQEKMELTEKTPLLEELENLEIKEPRVLADKMELMGKMVTMVSTEKTVTKGHRVNKELLGNLVQKDLRE